jgi:hypothetical protein
MCLHSICAPVSRCSDSQPPAASGSPGEKDYSERLLRSFADFDIANTHDCNTELKKRPKVQQFFEAAREHQSLADPKTRKWLASFPIKMRFESIPLFADGGVDYQLHPSYTELEGGQTVPMAHCDLFRLSINAKKWEDPEQLEDPNIVMGIGRLFVNVSKSQTERISKWTGYEVFVDKELALWMVFDRELTEQYTGGWYPLQCRLSQSISQDTGDEQHSGMLENPIFDIACFLPSLRDITVTEFASASKKVQETCRRGKITVDQVDGDETEKLLETEFKALAQQAILDAAKDETNGQMMADFFKKYKDDVSITGTVITREVVGYAAGNGYCGGRVMTILLDQVKDTVCKNISEQVVKAAAANWTYGDQIMKKLLNQCKDVVCQNVSVTAVKAAAENKDRGGKILKSLLEADRQRVENFIKEVLASDQGVNSPICQALKERLREIRYTPISRRKKKTN